MAAHKTLSLLIVLLLSLACTLGKPTEEKSNDDVALNEVESSKEELQKPKNQLLIFTYDNFKAIALHYVNEARNITKDILKDETLLGHSGSVEIEGFKKNLTGFMEKSNKYLEADEEGFISNLTDFMEKYNKYVEDDALFDLVDIFANATEFYMKLPNEAITADTTVIIETLKKYGSDKLEKQFDQLFEDYVAKFKKRFEELRSSLKEEKAMLEWFDQLNTLTKTEDKITAFDTFYALY